MPEWITVKEASQIRKCTPANMRYLINQGKVQGKKEKGRWFVNKESINEKKEFVPEPDVLSVLEGQLKVKDEQINSLQNQVDQLHQLLALEKQEKLQLMEHNEPWYRRWFRKRERENQV